MGDQVKYCLLRTTEAGYEEVYYETYELESLKSVMMMLKETEGLENSRVVIKIYVNTNNQYLIFNHLASLELLTQSMEELFKQF